MNFEDIVDMDWVDTHTEENEVNNTYFNQNMLLETSLDSELKIEIPSTDQIKQLIEIAKQQLALREHLQLLQQTKDYNLYLNNEVQTAAPSTIFAPPPLDTVTTVISPNDITSTDMTLIPQITQENEVSKPKRRDSISSVSEEYISLETYAEADGIDLKKLTPKERRQLRNKISARNFRVRRKEYISTLEGQVNEHKMKTEALKEKLLEAEDENKKLYKEMDILKKQNQLLQQQLQKPPSSPRILPNLNKDISIMGTKATDSYRQQENFILVSNVVMPEWDYQSILSKPLPQSNDYMNKLVAHFILHVLYLATVIPTSTTSNNISSSNDHSNLNSSIASNSSNSSSFNMEDLYDSLIQSALINNVTADKSFLWSTE